MFICPFFLQESVELPLTHPEYYEEMGIKPPKGVILFGPPGTGKSVLLFEKKNVLMSKHLIPSTTSPTYSSHRIASLNYRKNTFGKGGSQSNICNFPSGRWFRINTKISGRWTKISTRTVPSGRGACSINCVHRRN